MTGDVFMLMIEPTPYVVGFLREVARAWPGRVDVAFVARNLSQDWTECEARYEVLPSSFPAALFALWKRLRKRRYCLVHLAGWGHGVTLAAMMLCWMRGIPTAVESDTPDRQGDRGWRGRLNAWLHELLFCLPSVFLPGGTRQALYFRAHGVPEDRIRIAQMTVDTEAIAAFRDAASETERRRTRAHWGLGVSGVAFLFVGRLEEHKGIRTLLAAFEELRGRSGGDSVLVIAGDGSRRSEIEDAAQRNPAVVPLGRLAGDSLLEVFVAADVLVLPSLREPWGLVVNEAMAAGLPVIATNIVGSAADLIVPEVTGLLVPPGDVSSLVDTMRRMKDCDSLRRSMGDAARERIRPWSLANEAGNVVAAWREGLRR